jgi:hypothetical protein
MEEAREITVPRSGERVSMRALRRIPGILCLTLVLQGGCGTRPNPAWDGGAGDADDADVVVGCDDACPPGRSHCVEGSCYAGGAGDPCDDDSDCSLMTPRCGPSGCQDGFERDPCVDPGDCNVTVPICFDGACQDGSEGDGCDATAGEGCSAEMPFCVQGTCHDGSLGDPCESDEQCTRSGCGDAGVCAWY